MKEETMTSDGHWMYTYTGRRVHPFAMKPEDIVIEDVAHALSNLCRYTGHTLAHYSVGQHSCLVSHHSGPHALHGLLHDAAEAYVSDLSRPVKQALRGHKEFAYDRAEASIMLAVWARFGMAVPDAENNIKGHVDRADMLLLATEARDLMRQPLPDEWIHQAKHGWPVLPDRISPWSPGRSEYEFMIRFHGLTGGAFR